MKKLLSPFLAFYSKPFYRDIAFKRRGQSFVAFFLLAFILELAIMGMLLQTNPLTNVIKTVYHATTVPNINIQNGIITSDNQTPFILKDNNNQPVLIIDTKNVRDETVKPNSSVVFLITQHAISFRTWKNDIFTLHTQTRKDVAMTDPDHHNKAALIGMIFGNMMLEGGVAFITGLIINILLFTAWRWLAAKSIKSQMKEPTLNSAAYNRLGLASMTPAIVALTIYISLSTYYGFTIKLFPAFWVITLFAYLFYVPTAFETSTEK